MTSRRPFGLMLFRCSDRLFGFPPVPHWAGGLVFVLTDVMPLGRPTSFALSLYENHECVSVPMNTISVNQFRDQLKSLVEQVISKHEPLKVMLRTGTAFVVMSAEDWERERETLHILQSRDLMHQIAESLETHTRELK